MEAVETFRHAGNVVAIHYDEDCENPYTAYDQATVMVCWHRRMNLGSEQAHPERFESMDAMLDYYQETEGALHIRPVYAYEHSGITVSLGAFSDPWDSGQVGFVFTTRKLWDERVGSEMTEENIAAVYRAEVETYDSYLRGECYGYTVESPEGDTLDSCWGFLGDIEYCRAEAMASAEAYANE